MEGRGRSDCYDTPMGSSHHHGATMPKMIEKGTPMSQVMIVVEFEVKPEHRSQFIELRDGAVQ